MELVSVSLNANLNRRTKEGFCSNISPFTCVMVLKDVVKDEKAALCHKGKKLKQKANAGGEKLRVRGRKLQRAVITNMFSQKCLPHIIF